MIIFCLVVVFYTAFKGAYYFLANRLQELGILFSLILFLYSSFLAALNVRDKDLKWTFWMSVTILFLCFAFILPGYIFSNNIGVSMMPSVAASREFLIALIGPALYFLGRIGFDVDDLSKIITVTIGSIVISYIFHYLRIDLAAANLSSDVAIKGMVTNDARGLRLKAPSVALFMGTIISGYLAFKKTGDMWRYYWVAVFGFAIFSWIILQARAPTAMLILGTLIYHFCFARKTRVGMLLIVLATLLTIYPFVINQYFLLMSQMDGGVRYNSYLIAFNVISEYPILGLGQASNYTLSEGDLFGHHFYSSDLGIIGVTFKHGILGAILYVFFVIYALVRAVKINWLIVARTGSVNILLVAAIIKLFTDLLMIVLSYHYVQVHGVALVAMVIAITALYKLKYQVSK